jgi:hypothetical protein
MTDPSAAHPEHPAGSASRVVLKCVRKSTLLELMAGGVCPPGYHILNDRSYQDVCTRCDEPVMVSETARCLPMGVRRVDTAVDGCIEVKHVEPLKIVLMCDVCLPVPLPDPKTVKRETNGGT